MLKMKKYLLGALLTFSVAGTQDGAANGVSENDSFRSDSYENWRRTQ